MPIAVKCRHLAALKSALPSFLFLLVAARWRRQVVVRDASEPVMPLTHAAVFDFAWQAPHFAQD